MPLCIGDTTTLNILVREVRGRRVTVSQSQMENLPAEDGAVD